MNDDRLAVQRKFYTDLSPHGGQAIAYMLGGFPPPSLDLQEAEVKDSLSLWLKMQESGAGEMLTDTSWWMHHAMDPRNRMSRAEASQHSDELLGFVVSSIGQLLNANILKFVKEPDIAEIRLSTHEMGEEDSDILARLENIFKDVEDGK